jgi:hypothetical protein
MAAPWRLAAAPSRSPLPPHRGRGANRSGTGGSGTSGSGTGGAGGLSGSSGTGGSELNSIAAAGDGIFPVAPKSAG